MGLFLSLFFGFIPMLLFAWFVYWVDRYEKEPKFLLGGVFLWGALVAAGAAFLVNTSMALGIYSITHSPEATEFATGSLVAPLVEEILKGMAVLIVFLFARHEFDSILDGVIYAAVVALGFAATENTLYIFRDGYLEFGYAGLLSLVFIRVVLVGWQHPFYTAFFGIGLAVARLSRSNLARLVAAAGGLTLAIVFHALHNTLSQLLAGFGGFILSSLYDWSGWFFMFLFVLWAIYREQQWIVQQLSEEVQLGNLTAQQYQTACSTWRQSLARFGALFSSRFRTTSRFYQLCAELAYKKHQRMILGEEGRNSQIIQDLRAELARLSPQALA